MAGFSTDNFEKGIKEEFEEKVIRGFKLCGVSLSEKALGNCNLRIGIGVSGGADSVSLLYSLSSILKKLSISLSREFPIEVITVNHYMRPEEETCGDVRFVEDCCQNLKKSGFNVNCTVAELNPGDIEKTARVRQAGSEDAARFLRYNIFDSFVKSKKLDFLCLAHNKNDNLETILMRFLQGSNVDAGGGIRERRDAYIRPLLQIKRSEIEEYLRCLETRWCNDKTNDDTNYFRNNIRHNLIPFLTSNFGGWEKAVVSGAKKASEDAEIIKKIVDSFNITFSGEKEYVSFSFNDFCNLMPGIQKRVLIKACNLIGENYRISNTFLNDVIDSLDHGHNHEFSKFYGNNIEIFLRKNYVFVKKYRKEDTDLVFFDIIGDDGCYDFPFGKLSVTFANSGVLVSINGCNSFLSYSYPLCVRNAQQGDEIETSCGKMKKVADIYSSWHVANNDKKLIPVIVSFQNGTEKLVCILSAFLGYKDWIVK